MPRHSLTLSEFKEKAFKVHGEEFDYSKVDLNNRDNLNRICIIHKECGKEFMMTPGNHLSGQKCPHCRYKKVSERKLKTTEDYIKEAEKVWGKGTFDYSETVYKGATKRITIISHEINPITGKEYGKFSINASNHLKGCYPRQMCILMGGFKKKTVDTKEIIKRFREKYGDKYDYSRVDYKGFNNKVWICLHDINPLTGIEYGWFQQTPLHHLEGCTHPKMNGRGYTQDEIMLMFKRKHGDDYDYNEVNYESMIKKVKIICHKKDKFGNEHGVFEQTPHKHAVEGQGCPKCAGKIKKTTENFISELRLIYGDRLIYDNTVYINAKTKVRADCPKHGPQYRLPAQWLKGGGCTVCKCSIMENEMMTGLDKLGIKYIYSYNPLWLKSIKNHQQSVDFYLPDYNIAIECQGAQHFRDVEGFNKGETHKVTVERDANKRKILKEKNVHLVYYTNEHTIPEEFKMYFMYYNISDLFNDLINNNLKDIYGTTISKAYNEERERV